jgi:hypothetical protein
MAINKTNATLIMMLVDLDSFMVPSYAPDVSRWVGEVSRIMEGKGGQAAQLDSKRT